MNLTISSTVGSTIGSTINSTINYFTNQSQPAQPNPPQLELNEPNQSDQSDQMGKDSQTDKSKQLMCVDYKKMKLIEHNSDEKKEEFDELEKMLQDLVMIQEINQNLALIVGEQGGILKTIENEIIQANDIIESSNMELMKVEEYRIDNTVTKLTLSTIGTTAIGVVAISVAGIKIGLIVGAVMFVTGTAWSIWPQKMNS